MQYEIEITTGAKPASIDALTVEAKSALDAVNNARALTGNYAGKACVKWQGQYLPIAQVRQLESLA